MFNVGGWGGWIRTNDHGIKTRCLTAWLRPIKTLPTVMRLLRGQYSFGNEILPLSYANFLRPRRNVTTENYLSKNNKLFVILV